MPLSNADFIDMVTTVRSQKPAQLSQPNEAAAQQAKPQKRHRTKAEMERRREKKEQFLEQKKDYDEKQKELSEKYRDRAKERREDKNNDDDGVSEIPKGVMAKDQMTIAALQATARAAAANLTSRLPHNQKQLLTAKKRLQIEESKYLGGDIEHTHLVKGLDYALLEKKRAEIREEEKKKEEELEKIHQAKAQLMDKVRQAQKFQSAYAKRVCEIALNKSVSDESTITAPKINKNFLPGRMAFVFDTRRKATDIPTTIFRSEIEVSSHDRQQAESIMQSSTDGTNDIVLNKLIQILTYIRSGDRDKLDKKRRKIDPKEEKRPKMPEARGEDRSSNKYREKEREERDRRRDDRRRKHEKNENEISDRKRGERGDRRDDRDRYDRKDRDRNRRRDRHEEREAKFLKPEKPKIADDASDDDIFADCGSDYKPDLTKPKKTAQALPKNGKVFQKQDDDIENQLPSAPEKPTKQKTSYGTTDDVIAAANKLAEAKRRGLTLEQLEKEGSKAIPDGATGFGRLAVDEDYDDDDRFEDSEDIRRAERKRGKLMNHKSYANQQWQKVSGILDKKKGKK